jgi:hypothetical protein
MGTNPEGDASPAEYARSAQDATAHLRPAILADDRDEPAGARITAVVARCDSRR